MPDAEADEIAGAARYERRSAAKAGQLELGMPKLKGAVFESAVIERYKRREEMSRNP